MGFMTLKPAFQKYVFSMILSKLKCFIYRSYRFVTCFPWYKPGMSCFYPTKGWSDPKLIGHQGKHAGFHEDRNLDQWIFNGMTWGCNAQTPRNASHNQDCYIMVYGIRFVGKSRTKQTFVCPTFIPGIAWQLASCLPWPRSFSALDCLFVSDAPSVTNLYTNII